MRIAIKGAGPAGRVLAYRLSKEHDVDIYEKQDPNYHKPCGNLTSTLENGFIDVGDDDLLSIIEGAKCYEFDKMYMDIVGEAYEIPVPTIVLDKTKLMKDLKNKSNANFFFNTPLPENWTHQGEFEGYSWLIDCSGSKKTQERVFAVRRIRPCKYPTEGDVPQMNVYYGLKGYTWKWKQNKNLINEGIGALAQSVDKQTLNRYFDFSEDGNSKGAYIPIRPRRRIILGKEILFGDAGAMVSPCTGAGLHLIFNMNKYLVKFIDGELNYKEFNKEWRRYYKLLFEGYIYQKVFFLFFNKKTSRISKEMFKWVYKRFSQTDFK